MQLLKAGSRALGELLDDECGATLTTELLLLSTLTVAGILTVADEVRTGIHSKANQLVAAISAPISDSPDHVDAFESLQCVTVIDLND